MTHRYEMDDVPIATGGQGAVYFGTREDGLPVAMKVAAAGNQAARALQREVELLTHMRDAGVKGVMPILDAQIQEGRLTMVMPRYPRHLGDWLKVAILEPSADTLPDIFRTLVKLARTLSAIHNVYHDGGTVVHRDIKPENIYLDGRGGLYIGDFGGAMAVEELRAVELAMFGTPMWAPLDQLLPGRSIPDTTWDTYATAVLLYAAVTGARPAYQADPTELLTPAGNALWEVARNAVEATGDDRKEAQRRFAVMRRGTVAADLIDVTGRAALVDGDRRALHAGLVRLGGLAGTDPAVLQRLERGLWNVLVRALSPLSHPSPPNRYRDAAELADAIEDLSNLLGPPAASPTPVRPAEPPRSPLVSGSISLDEPVSHKTSLSAGPPVLAGVIGLIALLGLVGGGILLGPTLLLAFNATRPLPDRVHVAATTLKLPAGTVAVKPFFIDTTEVPASLWSACIAAGKCPEVEVTADGDYPAAPLRFQDAEAICTYRGGSVPSEAQWRAAHGPARFPWGDEAPACDQAIALGCAQKVMPVGAARQGGSPAGAIDLAGNVWEWVRGADGTPVLVGGSMVSSPKELGAAGRKAPPPDTPAALGGVRCAYPE